MKPAAIHRTVDDALSQKADRSIGLVCWFWCVTITSLRWIGVRQTDAALVVVDRKKARVAAPPTG